MACRTITVVKSLGRSFMSRNASAAADAWKKTVSLVLERQGANVSKWGNKGFLSRFLFFLLVLRAPGVRQR